MLSARGRFLQGQYQLGKLNNESLKILVEKNQITEKEYEVITGETYKAA